MSSPKKKITKSSALSGDDIGLSKLEQANLDQLFAQVLVRYKHDSLADKKAKIKEISHLSLMAEEYLSCFALIGYSVQDEKVVVFSTPTPKDEAALIDLLRSTFLDIISNRP